ncbi:hypothetical protein ACQFX9_14380 [Aliinostoc sp. HNIBRCY26]|uniref:hypothetical protein n=1 Tax=Aliinostoc sp. HNIBRCY26 TaxID=3418997 RepID=UPI003CFF31C1
MLYEKLALVENKLAKVDEKLGLPQRRHLLVRHNIYNTTTKRLEPVDTLIIPKPYITSVSPRFANLQVAVEGADSIFLSINDIQVEIPRVYPKSLFTPGGNNKVRFVIDPPVSENNQVIYSNPTTKAIDGVDFYKLVFLSDSNPTVWNLILQRERDRKPQ